MSRNTYTQFHDNIISLANGNKSGVACFIYKVEREFKMETSAAICIQALINNISTYLTRNACKNIAIIRSNNDHLSTNGELYFQTSLKVWTNISESEVACDQNCKTILQHFLHMQGINVDDEAETDIVKQVFMSLITASRNWLINIEKCSLQKEKVCLFLNRRPLVTNAIKLAIVRGSDFGKSVPNDKIFDLSIREDEESELTTARLRLIQKVTENMLRLHGCQVSNDESAVKLLFTTKSQGKIEESYEKYACGVVKNAKSNCKETSLTYDEHIRKKVKELEELNEHKYFEVADSMTSKNSLLANVAEATVTFQLLAIKPSRPVFIEHNSTAGQTNSNTKGAAFILYNTARIATIIEKYNALKSKGEYPNLSNIDDTDLSTLEQEEEWELVYNFVIGYGEMIRDCLKFEPNFQSNPHVVCLFLSRLCQKFSIYYRRIRILTKPYDHLIPTMIARLYMLHALQIVLRNTLALLDIEPVHRM